MASALLFGPVCPSNLSPCKMCIRDRAYTGQAHLGLAEMYTADERFLHYYDAQVPGCAEFLKEAIKAHIQEL